MNKILLPLAVAIENLILWRYAFKLGVIKEQQARFRRVAKLRKLLNNK